MAVFFLTLPFLYRIIMEESYQSAVKKSTNACVAFLNSKSPPGDYSGYDAVVVEVQEFWGQYATDLIDSLTNPIVITTGIPADPKYRGDNVLLHPWFAHRHFNYLSGIYCENEIQKPYLFDCLLRSPKPHRDMLSASIMCHPRIKDQTLMSYLAYGIYCPPEYLESEDTIGPSDTDGEKIRYLSNIPHKIFHDSYHSLIAETWYREDHNQWAITEKAGKPLCAGRIFLPLANQGYLEWLEYFGFEYYHEVFDTSFDSMPYSEAKFVKYWQEIIKLSKLDPLEVLDQTQEKRKHNQHLAVNYASTYQSRAAKFILDRL